MKIPTDQLARTFQIARDSEPRLVISKVVADSQAEKIRLEAGDVILEYDGKQVRSLEDLSSYKEAAVSESVEMVILRREEKKTFTLQRGPIGIFTVQDYY